MCRKGSSAGDAAGGKMKGQRDYRVNRAKVYKNRLTILMGNAKMKFTGKVPVIQ